MLDKEFVPYQESLELKELGFDEDCFTVYCDHWKDGEPYLWKLNQPDYAEYWDLNSKVNAPTFSQAFRWFREKFNLHHEIEYNGFEYLGYVSGMTANIFKTYEEAELECLRKLIEIVKEK